MSNKARRLSARFPFATELARGGMLALVVVTSVAGCVPDGGACCSSDAECDQGALCFEGLCASACHDDSQCDVGKVCLAGACAAPLRSPSHCPYGDKREPPAGETDGGSSVDAGEEGDGTPVENPMCQDAFEPNDDAASAGTLEDGAAVAGVCPAGDDDWYRRSVPEGAFLLRVVVGFEHDDGDLDVEVLDAEGNRMAVSQLTGDVEEILLPVSGPREVLVHVYGFGQATNLYTVSMELEPPAQSCLDDALEENDSVTNASPMEPGDDVAALFCAGDPDVYAALLPSGNRALAVLSYEGGDALNLEVRDQAAGIVGSSTTFSGVELVPFTTESEGLFHMRVGGTHDQVVARPYRVSLRLTGGACGSDEHEPNDVPAEGVLFSLPANDGARAVTGVLCDRDVDVWRLVWTPGSTSIALELETAAAARGYVVRRADLSLIDVVEPGVSTTLLPGMNVVSDEVLVVLVGAGAASSSYALRGRALMGE